VPVPDPFKTGWFLLGSMENLLLAFRENPRLVDEVIRVGTDFCFRAIDLARDIGIDSMIMSGDLACERGLLFSLSDYRRFLKSSHARIVEYARKHNMLLVKHSDGDVREYLDDWIEVGFDGIHPLQPQCVDIGEVKSYLEGRMAILGNLDCRELLVFGTLAEVRETVRRTIAVAGPGGGYIVSSSNSIHPGCRADNYLAMVRAAQRHGSYPLSSTLPA
jgi:uroporphyrinogen decarboxylase